MDTTAFKGKPLLNNAIRLEKFFDSFREKQKKLNANKEVVVDLSANYFNYLSEMLEQADLKAKPLNSRLKDIISRKGKSISGNNIIPIGVINADALLLTKEQLDANQDAKKKNTKADAKGYETIEFIGAGLLQSEAFQGFLGFEIDPTIAINNLDNSIKGLSIDFNDGKGFEDYEWKQQIIPHQFTKAGDVIITIKLSTKKGVYISNCPIKIHFLDRPIPSFSGTVSVSGVNKGGRVAANVVGAEYSVYNGCDGILDKPIIIAEGYDGSNSVGIEKLVSYYQNDLRILTNNGYDLVFVNYNDGGDFIENNAQALKRVIQEINNRKIGQGAINKLSIIGISMSGLVARWALREMENAGQNHQVERLICLDTPHRGANSSPGVSYVAADFSNQGLASGILEAFLYNIVPELSSINRPAAQQQLLFQNTSMTSNANFTIFRNALNNLGNGGYPSQCKNIAFINGSLNGGNFNFKYGTTTPISPGEKIWDTDFYLGICFDFIDCWTNNVNQNTEVYNEDAFGYPLLCSIQFSRRSINLPYNLDRLAGGFNSIIDDQFFQSTTTFPRFSFVPTFSSVDYRGALVNDADYSININDWLDANRQVRADRQNLTPFRAIYGNDVNNSHSFLRAEITSVEALATNEFGINPANFSGCQVCGTGTGLQGRFYDNIDLTDNANTLTSINSIEYSSDERRFTPGGSVTIGPPFPVSVRGTFPRANISARWEGSFEAPITANYTFNMRTDDGTRVWFDGVPRVEDWNYFGPTDHKFQVSLNAGQRKNIKIEWKQGSGGYEAKLWWEFNGVASIIPACRLFSTSAPTGGGGCVVNKVRLMFRGGDLNNNCCYERLQGAKIQGLDGNGNWTDLHTITSSGNSNWQDFPFTNTTAYTSVRFVAGPNSYGELTELEFYSNNTKLSGTAFGTGNYDLALDGSTTTSWHGWPNTGAGNYAGIQLNACTGCTSPQPTISANPSSIAANQNSTLTASGCTGGTVTWNDGTTGTTKTVSASNTYSATCSVTGCGISSLGTVTVLASGTGCVVNKVRLMFRGGDLNNNCCYERLQGSKIQGLDGNGNWTDLYTITSSGNSNWQDFPFTNTTAYTSVRFVAGPNSYGELTELEFYNNNTKLSGTAFGTGNYDLALDGSTTTSWHGWPTTGAVNIAGLNLTGCTGTGGGGGNPACTTNKVRLIFRGGDLNNGCCYDRLVGAKIQGTNNLSNPWNDLYTITANGNSNWQDFPFSNPTAYNYVRFVAGPTSYGELTELEFYNNNTKLTGSIFGTDNFALALDGSLTTSWHGWPNTGVANYAGIQISGCTGTRIGVEEITLKTPPIRELEDWDVKISPNPTAGKVKVEFELSQATKVRLNIYDLQGKSLIVNDFEGKKGKNLIELDLTDLQHGSYLLNIQTDKERSSKRVIRID